MSSATPSATETVQATLDRIESTNPTLNAVITVAAEQAVDAAHMADEATARGEWMGLLHGMPMLVKDNIDAVGMPATSGASWLEGNVPNRDATVVQRLKAAGAILLGKANLHELCFGIRSNNSVAGQCKNPWSPNHIPGGSSGGSGSALAANFCLGALGSDTGGSVRLPASMNGVSGLRPTVGRVPNTGSMPCSASQDTIGPMARRVSDVARILAAISGYDPADPVTEPRTLENFLPSLDDGIEGVRIGIPRAGYFDGADPQIQSALQEAAKVLEGLGANLVDVDVPGMQQTHRWASVVIFSDVCEIHGEQLRESPEAFDKETYDRMISGFKFTGVDYARAMRMRERWKRTLAELFGEVDALLSPTVHTEVPLIADDKDLLQATRDATRNTYAGAFGQIPGLSVPCGLSGAGLPIGMQLEAAWWQEPLLLRIGHSFQKETDWHLRTPPA